MARIRTVKPSVWGDERFVQLSRDARLLFLGIISTADDAGRFIATVNTLSGTVFPHDELSPSKVRRWRDEVAATGLVQLYRVGGREYGYLPKWRKHQRIDRPQPSTLPPPPGAAVGIPVDEPPDDDPFGDAFDEDPANGSPQEGKGGDGKGIPPNPPPSGGRRCTAHKRHRAGCTDCDLPAVAVLPEPCGNCSPSRYVEDDAGRPLHPCPACHPKGLTA